MTHQEALLLPLSLAVLLATGLVCGRLARAGGMPVVVGELAGGIVLGPTVLGRLAPGVEAAVFPAAGALAIARTAVIQIGLLGFLFAAGLEMDVPRLRKLGRAVAWTSGSGIALPMVAGALLALVPSVAAHVHASTAGAAAFLGVALSISALPVIARLLMDLGLLRDEVGTVVLAAATLDDLVGWSLFAAVLAIWAPGEHATTPVVTVTGLLAFATMALTIGRWTVSKLREPLRAQVTWPGGLIGVAAACWLAGGAAAEVIGVHAVVGAFLVGVAFAQGLDDADRPTQVVEQFTLGVSAPLYFASMGLRTDFVAGFEPVLCGLVLAVACVGKVLGVSAGARWAGMPASKAWAIGFGMNARGAMEMILAAVALERGLVDPAMFVALVFMALVTSVASGPVMARSLRS